MSDTEFSETIDTMGRPVKPDLCPLVPDQLQVILAGLHLIAAEVGELKTYAVDKRIAQQLRRALRELEWRGTAHLSEGQVDAVCLFCGAPKADRPQTNWHPFELGGLHGIGCEWVRLMKASEALT